MACTADTLVGDASSCDAECSYVAITACTNGDGCCPSGCNATTDDDCSPICGNLVVEAPETCDGDCPTACDDSMACTTDMLVGSASSCDAACSFVTMTACTNLTNFASGVTAVNHPAGAGVYGTWYDVTHNAATAASIDTLESSPAMRITDPGFTNGVYAIFSGAVPATGNYRVEVRMHVVELLDPADPTRGFDGLRAYRIGVATGASAVHRGDGSTLLAGLPISGSYATMTTGDDTALGPITVTTSVFSATAGDDVLIGFGTDVTSGAWNLNAAWAGSSYVLVGDVMLMPVP
jgi:hypothetical protein